MAEIVPLIVNKFCSISGIATSGQTVEIQIGQENHVYDVPEGKKWKIKVAITVLSEENI